jgi:hypothetical protein
MFSSLNSQFQILLKFIQRFPRFYWESNTVLVNKDFELPEHWLLAEFLIIDKS